MLDLLLLLILLVVIVICFISHCDRELEAFRNEFYHKAD